MFAVVEERGVRILYLTDVGSDRVQEVSGAGSR
jgi:hypothetical protein